MVIFIFLYLHVKLRGLYSIVDILEPCRYRLNSLKLKRILFADLTECTLRNYLPLGDLWLHMNVLHK